MSQPSAPYLDPNPAGTPQVRVTAVETVILENRFPGLIFLRLHTDAGYIGHGETYYAPHAVAGTIHDWMARRLLGNDALAVECHWRFLYERAANFGVRGAELRAISAIDLALWDILGQHAKMPVYRLLGGPVRQQIACYNSLGHPNYGKRIDGQQGWPGYGGLGVPGPLNDAYAIFHAPEELAHSLLEAGYTAFKTWLFDDVAHQHGGMRISLSDLDRCLEPLRRVREAVGTDLEFMVDGHGFFMLPAAQRIVDGLAELQPLWVEDVLKMDNLETLADFRQRSPVPVSVSEMLLTRPDFARVLEARAADFIQIDPTWCGGISESIRIAHMAQAYNLPVTTHDCTGPLTTWAGIHINAVVPGCCFQETVRAHVETIYKDLVDLRPMVKNGYCPLPTGPGLGVTINPDLFTAKEGQHRITRL